MTRQIFAVVIFAFLLICAPHPAHATVVNCDNPTYSATCATIVNFSVSGGPTPYVYVSDNFGQFLDLSDATQINYSCPSSSCAGVSELASGSLATGVLKASGEAVNVYDDSDTVNIQANDIFTLQGPAGSEMITATFTVTGTAYLAAVNAGQSILIDGGDAHVNLCGPGGSFACGGDVFQDTGSAPFFGGTTALISQNTGDSYLQVSYTWSQQVGVPFDLSYGMSLDAYSGSAIDMTDPGTLSFNLPTGYSVTSQGGFNSNPVSTAPEPGTMMVGIGLGAVAFIRRRRRQAR